MIELQQLKLLTENEANRQMEQQTEFRSFEHRVLSHV